MDFKKAAEFDVRRADSTSQAPDSIFKDARQAAQKIR
jgi:hypothetical protein